MTAQVSRLRRCHSVPKVVTVIVKPSSIHRSLKHCTPKDLEQPLSCTFDAARRLKTNRVTSLQTFYARRAHGDFASTRGDSSLLGCPWPPRPWRAAPRLGQAPPSDPPFPSLYLSSEETTRRYVRKCRASKTASEKLFVGIAAKPGLGLLTSSLQPMQFISPALKLQHYVVSQLLTHAHFFGFAAWIFFPHRSPHMTGLCCWHNCAKPKSHHCKRCKYKE